MATSNAIRPDLLHKASHSAQASFHEQQLFAPTTCLAAIHTLLALDAIKDWEIESIDISNAYLNGILPNNKTIYIRQAEGYEDGNPDMVYQLREGLYGLKQRGCLWYEKVGEVLEGMGLSDSSQIQACTSGEMLK